MSNELIDTLVTKSIHGGVDERQTFTVNTGVNDVPMDTFVAGQGILRPGSSASYKVPLRDNISLLSIGINLPYNFVMSTRGFLVTFFWNDGFSQDFLLGGTGYFEIPMINYELSLGTFIPFPINAVAAYKIIMQISPINFSEDQGLISMIGVPAALNGLQLPVTAFAKLTHNKPLIA